MREEFPDPSKEKDEDEELDSSSDKSKTRGRGEEFLRVWLRRLRGQSLEQEPEQGGGLYERFRRGLKGIFGGVVEQEPVTKLEGSVESPVVDHPETLASTAVAPESTVLGAEPAPLERVDTTHETAELRPETPNQPPAEAEPSAETPPLNTMQEVDLDRLDQPEAPEHTVEIVNPDEEAALQSEVAPAVHAERRASSPLDLPPIPQPGLATERASMAVPEIIAVPDKQATALAALTGVGLVAETVGRRRADRKLRREDQKIDKKVSAVRKDLTETQERTQKLEQTAATTQEATERLGLWQQAFERRPETKQTKPDKLPASHAMPEKPQPIITSEAISTQQTSEAVPPAPQTETVEQLQASPEITAEKVLQKTEQVLKPEVIREKLERVEAAVERNVPIEGNYERRHEIKDEPSKISTPKVAAASLAAVAVPTQAPPLDFAVSSGSPQVGIAQNPTTSGAVPSTNSSPYRKAAVNGMTGAGVILIILALVFLFT